MLEKFAKFFGQKPLPHEVDRSLKEIGWEAKEGETMPPEYRSSSERYADLKPKGFIPEKILGDAFVTEYFQLRFTAQHDKRLSKENCDRLLEMNRKVHGAMDAFEAKLSKEGK